LERTLGSLGLTDRTDPVTKIVALKLIEFARQGERDPQRLSDLTLQAIQPRPRDTGPLTRRHCRRMRRSSPERPPLEGRTAPRSGSEPARSENANTLASRGDFLMHGVVLPIRVSRPPPADP